mgnify:CR=1 FL=1
MNPTCEQFNGVLASIEYFVLMLAFMDIIILLPAVKDIVATAPHHNAVVAMKKMQFHKTMKELQEDGRHQQRDNATIQNSGV